MDRCIQLAKNSRYSAAPNPMVGCVIVHNNEIIGEGYTSAFGGPHAEVNAIESVEDKSLLSRASLYVSLEPCSHFGKTPPCADHIIKYNLPRVIIGTRDPNHLVTGNGIQKLVEAGCQVTVGVLEDACRQQNRRFFVYHQKKRPYIILKWAQSADGFIAPDPSIRSKVKEAYWITNPKSRQMVHQWRAEEQAILIGTNTALADNPQLSTRDYHGASPARVVLDRELRIPKHFHLMDGSIKTIVLTESTDLSKRLYSTVYEILDFSGNMLEQLCRILWKHHLLSVIIEGGAKTLKTFIEAGLWDEARVFTGPSKLQRGINAPEINGVLMNQSSVGTDQLKIYSND